MIRITALYPNKPSGKFNFEYYNGKHADLVRRKLEPRGLVQLENTKGIGGVSPGEPPPYIAIGYLLFKSIEDFQEAFAAHGEELMADIPNYTDIEPQIQVSEVLE
jgi:uncharacterized protein (TIGR02118 family)